MKFAWTAVGIRQDMADGSRRNVEHPILESLRGSRLSVVSARGLDGNDVSGPAIVGDAATPKALHAAQGHADGVGRMHVSFEHMADERRLQQLDAECNVASLRSLEAHRDDVRGENR